MAYSVPGQLGRGVQYAVNPYQLTWSGGAAYLRGGQEDADFDFVPIAYSSVLAFRQFWAGSTALGPFAGAIPGIAPSTAVALQIADPAPFGNFVLFMPPSQLTRLALHCFMQLGVTNCPMVGPVIPNLSTWAQAGAQYVAVMPDSRKVPCFGSCRAPSPLSANKTFLTPLPM